MNRVLFLLKIFAVCLVLSGCSIGKNKTYCEENGADYSTAGVCDDMLEILNNPNATIEKAYKNTEKCGKRGR